MFSGQTFVDLFVIPPNLRLIKTPVLLLDPFPVKVNMEIQGSLIGIPLIIPLLAPHYPIIQIYDVLAYKILLAWVF